MKLCPKALLRKMRFHDLRHTTATLLLRAGVDLHRVQRILRHRDVKLTTDTYGHLDVEDLRSAVETLPISGFIEASLKKSNHPNARKRFAKLPGSYPNPKTQKTKAPASVDFSSEAEAFEKSGRQDSNLRPLAPQASALPGCATPRFFMTKRSAETTGALMPA